MKFPTVIAARPPSHRFIILAAICSLPFLPLLWDLVRFALNSNLYSYTLLIPFVTIYLFRTHPDRLTEAPPAWRVICGLTLLESILLLGWMALGPWDRQTSLAWGAACFIVVLWIAAFTSLGRKGVVERLFPLGLLILAIPYPTFLETGLETLLQHGSAEAANLFFLLSGMTFFRDDLSFQLPTIRLMIAPECSGIHSSVVLFVVSLVAGYLFLRSKLNRVMLTLFVLPLALLRNGFRVWVLGELCVRISPSMIDSPIHHKGGPIFFVLSLIPFMALLYALVRRERREALGKPAQL